MKTIMTAITIWLATITSSYAGWVSTPNFEKMHCEAHTDTRTIDFGVLVFPVVDQVGVLSVFGKGAKLNTQAYIEFGPSKFGPYYVGDFQAWSSTGLLVALAKAERDGLSIRVQIGDQSSWFVMQGFAASVKQCVELMTNAKGV